MAKGSSRSAETCDSRGGLGYGSRRSCLGTADPPIALEISGSRFLSKYLRIAGRAPRGLLHASGLGCHVRESPRGLNDSTIFGSDLPRDEHNLLKARFFVDGSVSLKLLLNVPRLDASAIFHLGVPPWARAERAAAEAPRSWRLGGKRAAEEGASSGRRRTEQPRPLPPA